MQLVSSINNGRKTTLVAMICMKNGKKPTPKHAPSAALQFKRMGKPELVPLRHHLTQRVRSIV